MSVYKSIIFDFDGVIADSVQVKTEAFAEMYAPCGKEIVKKVIAHHLQNSGVSRFLKFKHYHKIFLGIDLSEEEIQEKANQFSSIVLNKVINAPYIKGSYEFISSNYMKYDFFVCSGTPENEINLIIQKRGLNNYFKGIFGAPKTKPEILKIILNTYEVKSNQVIFIGDAMTDYNAAKELNIPFIGIQSDHTTFPENTVVNKNFIVMESTIKKL